MRRARATPKITISEKMPDAYSSGLQPTMSSSNILLECSYAYGKDVRREAGTPARYGSAFHVLLAARILNTIRAADGGKVRPIIAVSPKMVAKQWGVEDAHEELTEHMPAAHAELIRWLSKNEYRIDFED